MRDVVDTDLIIFDMQESDLRVAAALENADTLERVDFGIAPSGVTERLNAAADAGLTKNGLSVLLDAIRVERSMLQDKQNGFTVSMTEMLAVMLIQLWHLWCHQQVLDIRVWILGHHISATGGALCSHYLRWPRIENQVQKKPLTWSTGKPWQAAAQYAVVVAAGLLLVEQAVVRSVPMAPTASYAQAFSLYILLVCHGLESLVRNGPRFWTRKSTQRCLAGYLFLDLVLTALCAVGWFMPGSALSLLVCVWVWTIAIATFAALWVVRCLTRTGSYTFLEDYTKIWPRYRRPLELL